MIRSHLTLAAVIAGTLLATAAHASGTFTTTSTTASLKFDTQSAATAGNLTFGIYDSTGQFAPVFDNTSPPSNPVGIGPVDPGALATLTLAIPNDLTVDVVNQDPTGFPLGYGNTTTEYTDFIGPFGAYVTDGATTYYTDDSKNPDGLSHIIAVQSQGNGYEIEFSATAGGPYTDATVFISGITAGSSVPEPASLALLAAPLLLALRRRRA